MTPWGAAASAEDAAVAAEETSPKQPWELEENLIPETGRRSDENKFAVSHAWSDGRRYERPEPRRSGILYVELERAEAAVREDEPWWTGFLPG